LALAFSIPVILSVESVPVFKFNPLI